MSEINKDAILPEEGKKDAEATELEKANGGWFIQNA